MADFVHLCKEMHAIPIIQLNAALAFVNGTEVASNYYLRQHEALLDMGLTVRYYEFGNENYGTWEPPYPDFPVDGTLYGEAFVAAAKVLTHNYDYVKMGIAGKYSDSSDTADTTDDTDSSTNTDGTTVDDQADLSSEGDSLPPPYST